VAAVGFDQGAMGFRRGLQSFARESPPVAGSSIDKSERDVVGRPIAGAALATPLPHPAGMTIPTADECWARDMLAAPWRERLAWVSARNALLHSHLIDLHRELGEVVDGRVAAARALDRIQHLRAALDQIERRLVGLQRVSLASPLCADSATGASGGDQSDRRC